MALSRDNVDERQARIDHLIEELEATRDVATKQILQAQRTINEVEATIKRLRAELVQHLKR
jgi:hypothetical protein